ncbi:hypothetical protein [Ectothiorhodospira sp. BSL-9]|uniref:hypothetical protein n=1 Tax=Ectothiorhodospira sp. BSL-9 TaxID=1442136 RepID=UPI001F0A87F2|nr:hypothetical protein [Ectothiorhodospira sp. BSL-9]
MTSEELYELARQRQEDERRQMEEEQRERLSQLQAQRSEVVARHKAELAALDKQIKQLGAGKAKGRGRGSSASNLSQHVVDIINERGQMSTRELKGELESRGFEARNISQTLAYLKRNGRVVNTARGIYAAA